MERKNQKINELSKSMQTLKETEKGMLKGGFMGISILSLEKKDPHNPDKNVNNNNSLFCSCSCTN